MLSSGSGSGTIIPDTDHYVPLTSLYSPGSLKSAIRAVSSISCYKMPICGKYKTLLCYFYCKISLLFRENNTFRDHYTAKFSQ